MLGNFAIYTALITIFLALWSYLFKSFGKDYLLKFGRKMFFLHTIALSVSTAYLFYSLIAQKFEYAYVYQFTDKTLEFRYVISAFWAGQEGTYLLWAILGAAIGLLLIKREGADWEGPLLVFVSAVQLVLVLFLVIQSPFREVIPNPTDGLGLNPLLKNPWMVIHPPLVFIGYALLLVPMAYALGAMWKKQYGNWVNRALPWTLLGWTFLGAGIIVGGYWAYRVLGWGGYWSWDPVENASLVPWLFGAALVHGMLVQKYRSGFKKTNIGLAITTYVFVIYATFLTRSGVLADFSVHAFSRTPVYLYLGIFLFLLTAGGAGFFFFRMKNIGSSSRGISEEEGFLSKTGFLALSVAGFSISGILIILGTSAPIFTGWFGPPSSVEESFYVQTNLPIALFLCLLLAGSVYLPWKKNNETGGFLKKLLTPLILSMAGGLVAIFLGVYSPLHLLIIVISLLAFWANVFPIVRIWRAKGFLYTGGYFSHLGVAIMLIGFLTSTALTQGETIFLTRGESQESLGYTLNFEGKEIIDEREYYRVLIDDGKKEHEVEPQVYYAGREPRRMREPAVLRYWWGDLYVSPLETQTDERERTLTLRRGETTRIGDLAVTFTSFQAPEHSEQGAMRVGANLVLSFEDQEIEATATMARLSWGWDREPVLAPGGGHLYLEGLTLTMVLQLFILSRLSERERENPWWWK